VALGGSRWLPMAVKPHAPPRQGWTDLFVLKTPFGTRTRPPGLGDSGLPTSRSTHRSADALGQLHHRIGERTATTAVRWQ
jgi:hypothetical protein